MLQLCYSHNLCCMLCYSPCCSYATVTIYATCNVIPHVAAMLQSQFMLHVMLFPTLHVLYIYISTFPSLCAVTNMAVFCSSLISCFPSTLLKYFVSEFDIFPVSPIIAGITYIFTFHLRCISTLRYLCCKIFWDSLLITFPLFRNCNIYYYCCFLLSQAFPSRYFSWTSGDPHRSGFKLHTAVLSVLCVMFQVQLSFVVNLSSVLLVWLLNISLNTLALIRWLNPSGRIRRFKFHKFYTSSSP